MKELDPNWLQESIEQLLNLLNVPKSISELEFEFFNPWLEPGRQLFEKMMQTQIEIYEKSLKGSHQRCQKRFHSRLGTIDLSRRSYRTPKGLKSLADEEFRLPSHGWLPTVEKLACAFGIETDFENASQLLEETTQIQVSGHILANHVKHLGLEMQLEHSPLPVEEIAMRDSALFKTVASIQEKPYVYVGMDGVII